MGSQHERIPLGAHTYQVEGNCVLRFIITGKEISVNESGEGRERRAIGYFPLLILVNLMWAFQYTGAKIATEKLGPITVALLPMAMATVLLSLLLFLDRRRKSREASRERGSFGRQFLSFLVLAVGGLVGQDLDLPDQRGGTAHGRRICGTRRRR